MDKFTDMNASRMLRDLILTNKCKLGIAFVDNIIFYRHFVTKITEKIYERKKRNGKRWRQRLAEIMYACVKPSNIFVHFSI